MEAPSQIATVEGVYVGFQLASGGVFGMDQPISFQLLGSEASRAKLEGVAMELEDSLYPLLREACPHLSPSSTAHTPCL